MGALFKPLVPMWRLIGLHPYLAALLFAVLAGLSAAIHSGHLLAMFTCIASMVIMYKVEADHPMPAGLVAEPAE